MASPEYVMSSFSAGGFRLQSPQQLELPTVAPVFYVLKEQKQTKPEDKVEEKEEKPAKDESRRFWRVMRRW